MSDLPEGWKWFKLGDVSIDISYGYTASAKKEATGPKFLRITDIVPDRINWETVPYCDIDDKNIRKYKLEKGDIVIARTGATTGYNKIMKKDIESVFASYLIRYRINKDRADPLFVWYNLQSYKWYGFVENIIGGSAQPGANAKQFASFEFPLPPLSEQKAIASVLSSLDDKIDLLHRQNKTLEEMAEALFRQWFIEEAKEEWEDGNLEDIADINPHYELKKGQVATYLDMKNVNASSFNPSGWQKRKFTSGMKFKNGDTLLARITPSLENGKTCFVTFLENDEVGWGSTEYIVIRMKKPFHPFISYVLAKTKEFRDFAISSMSGSSGRQRARAEVVKEYELKIPPFEVVEQMNEQMQGILSKLKNNAEQIRTLEKLRDTLLPKLMSGEVRVEIGPHAENAGVAGTEEVIS